MIARLKASLQYRSRLAEFGIFHLQSFVLNSVRIGGRRVDLKFPANEEDVLRHETGLLLFDDCYRLKKVPYEVSTVLDIGANVGLFALAARHRFPKAKIHSYEPNPDVLPYLSHHCDMVRATYFQEAVGFERGTVNLDKKENSLHTVSRPGGDIPVIPFSEAIRRLGSVDLLKLDCEGAEWEIFRDLEAWKKVRAVAMEYHLWSKPDLTVDDLRNILSELGFTVFTNTPGSDPSFGLAWASRSR